ncbi:hypothetical protein Tco_1509120 [Tanacetum coccineum]
MWIRRIGPTGYDISDLLDTAYQTSSIRRIGLIGYDVLGFLGTAYWLFGYGELAENVLLKVFDQSIIYGVSADVDTAYSSKSGNGLEFFKVLDTSYRVKEMTSRRPSILNRSSTQTQTELPTQEDQIRGYRQMARNRHQVAVVGFLDDVYN